MCYLNGTLDRGTVDGDYAIANFNAGTCRRRIRRDVPSGYPNGRIQPRDAVIGAFKFGPLLEVNDGKDDGDQGHEDQRDRTHPNS